MDVNVDVKTGAKKNPPPPTKAPNEVSVGVKTKGGNRIAPAAPKAPEAPGAPEPLATTTGAPPAAGGPVSTLIVLNQWFSTFGSWRPKKYNNTQFGDPYITIIVLKHRIW